MDENLRFPNLILSTERDHRTLAWLETQFSSEDINEAIQKVAGQRRAYLSNICKILNVSPPAQAQLTESTVAHERLTQLKQILKSKAK